MADIKIRIRAQDETGKAYASASANMKRFGGSADGAGDDANAAANKIRNMTGSLVGLNAGLTGSIGGLDRFSSAAGKMSSAIGKIGTVITAGIAGWKIGKRIDEQFDLSSRIPALFLGIKPEEVALPVKQAMERAERTYDEGQKRLRALSSAQHGEKMAEIDAKNPDATAAILKAVEASRYEAEQAAMDMNEAAEKLKQAQAKLEAIRSKPAYDVKEARAADELVKKSEQDLENAEKVAAARTRKAGLDLEQAKQETADKLKDMASDVSIAGLAAQAQVMETRTEQVTKEIENLQAAIAGLNDDRLKAVAKAALGGGDDEARALDAAKVDQEARDQLGQIQRDKRDPEVRQRKRELERERDRIDNEVKRAQQREAQGRKLTKREVDLLAEENALKQAAAQKVAKRSYQDAQEKIRQDQRDLAANRTMRNTEKMATDIAALKGKLETLLTAAR